MAKIVPIIMIGPKSTNKYSSIYVSLSFGVTKYASAPQTAVIKLSTNIIPKEILPPRIAAPTTPAVKLYFAVSANIDASIFRRSRFIALEDTKWLFGRQELFFKQRDNTGKALRPSLATLSRIPRPRSVGRAGARGAGGVGEAGGTVRGRKGEWVRGRVGENQNFKLAMFFG